MKPEEFTLYCDGRGSHGRLELYSVWLRDGRLISDRGHRKTAVLLVTSGPHSPSEMKRSRDRGGLWPVDVPESKDERDGYSKWRLHCRVCHPEGALACRRLGEEKFRALVETEAAKGRPGIDISLLPR